MKKFSRSKDGKLISGICAGLGKYFSIDPVLFRIAFIALALASIGFGIFLYIIASFITPMESSN